MAGKPYDPLAIIPSPEILRVKLRDTLALADRLRLLLDLSEQLHLPLTTGDKLATPTSRPDSSSIPAPSVSGVQPIGPATLTDIRVVTVVDLPGGVAPSKPTGTPNAS
jgi:hypothetical protein